MRTKPVLLFVPEIVIGVSQLSADGENTSTCARSVKYMTPRYGSQSPRKRNEPAKVYDYSAAT
jgi:hypothetical protein